MTTTVVAAPRVSLSLADCTRSRECVECDRITLLLSYVQSTEQQNHFRTLEYRIFHYKAMHKCGHTHHKISPDRARRLRPRRLEY